MGCAGLLKLMWETWNDVFGSHARPRRAHAGAGAARLAQQLGTPGAVLGDDADRALDSAAPPADGGLRAARLTKSTDEAGAAPADLRRTGPQREDARRRLADRERRRRQPEAVARGRDAARRRGERAIPAGGVRRRPLAGAPGEGADEYQDPAEFFRRTYLTEGLKRLLVGGVRRVSRRGWRSGRRSSRPTSAAARRTRCWRSITCSPARARATWLASTR